jgi:hypothetical protein
MSDALETFRKVSDANEFYIEKGRILGIEDAINYMKSLKEE